MTFKSTVLLLCYSAREACDYPKVSLRYVFKQSVILHGIIQNIFDFIIPNYLTEKEIYGIIRLKSWKYHKFTMFCFKVCVNFMLGQLLFKPQVTVRGCHDSIPGIENRKTLKSYYALKAGQLTCLCSWVLAEGIQLLGQIWTVH